MAPHIVASFDADLKRLSALVVEMGAKVRAQIADATQAWRERDTALAGRVIAADQDVDALQYRIEDMVIQMIARRQPVAVDLRETIATLKIASDLERVGDLAKNNAKRVIAMGVMHPPDGFGASVDTLSGRVEEQLGRVLEAYEGRDDALAQEVWSEDGEIDTLHTSLFRELLTYMMEDPRSIGYCTHLLFFAKNLERIGDHATNIAENVHFIATGELPTGARPKGASPSNDVDGGKQQAH